MSTFRSRIAKIWSQFKPGAGGVDEWTTDNATLQGWARPLRDRVKPKSQNVNPTSDFVT